MSELPPGIYFIVNAVYSHTGKPLALDYGGPNNDVIVTDFGTTPTQGWIVSDYSDGQTQSVSPYNSSNLQIGMGDDVLKLFPANDYVWTIRATAGELYTVQDGAQTVWWGLKETTEGEPVSFSPVFGSMAQEWWFTQRGPGEFAQRGA